MSDFSTELIRHFISGQSLFSGSMMFALAVVWRMCEWYGKEQVVWWLACMGAILVVCSSTPFVAGGGIWLTVMVTLGWLILARPPSRVMAEERATGIHRKFPVDRLLGFAVIILWAGECYQEIRWQILPQPITVSHAAEQKPVLIVMGDSLSAGMEAGEAVTWPRLLQNEGAFEIVDLSRMGATLASGTKRFVEAEEDAIQNEVTPEDDWNKTATILILLGGNDILGDTTVSQFERDLDELLSQVTSPDRSCVMFELPLPPFNSGFGDVQRRLARRYQVTLIPKRVLANLLVSSRTTLDSIHLNQLGQDQLAAIVKERIRFSK